LVPRRRRGAFSVVSGASAVQDDCTAVDILCESVANGLSLTGVVLAADRGILEPPEVPRRVSDSEHTNNYLNYVEILPSQTPLHRCYDESAADEVYQAEIRTVHPAHLSPANKPSSAELLNAMHHGWADIDGKFLIGLCSVCV
jgi:hypothetical protein